jgi:hypothetical protein
MTGFLGSAVLDVAIGLAFVYLLLALICTTANEWIAGLFKTRSKLLREGISQLLDSEPGLLDAFYKHPLVRSLMPGGKPPAYIPARTFASAVIDLLSPGPHKDIGSLQNGLERLKDDDLKVAFTSLIRDPRIGIDEVHERIEGWFEDAMDQVSGWYKRKTQIWTLLVALGLTIAVNADTLKIVRHLWTDPALRSAVVEEAKARAAEPRPSVEVEYKDVSDPMKPTVRALDPNRIRDRELELMEQLLGWGPEEKRTDQQPFDWFLRIVGWILSATAISLGAPFWFDVLNKFINVRSAGKSPSEAAKKPEKKQRPPEDMAA